MKMIHLTMVLAKKVSISSDPANVLLSYPNACLSNICSMNMRSFFDCSKNAISYKAKNRRYGITHAAAYIKILFVFCKCDFHILSIDDCFLFALRTVEGEVS